jgi:hypothetical protein
MSNTTAKNDGVNRAKLYQLALFPLNNGATNVYFVLILSYVAQFGSSILQLGLYASLMVTIMRICDAITDPIIGALMDRTSTRWGKFRPFMVIGSVIMAISVICLYILLPLVPETMMAEKAAPEKVYRSIYADLLRLGHRLHVPDQRYPRRSDCADERPESAPDVHHLQHHRLDAGHGRDAIPDSAD